MALYLKKQLILKIAQDESYKDIAFVRGNAQSEVAAQAALAESQGGSLVIPDSTTDLEIPLGPEISAGRYLYLSTDQQISFKLGGVGNTALDLQPPATGVLGELHYDGSFSSVHVSNASGSTANVFFIIVGA